MFRYIVLIVAVIPAILCDVVNVNPCATGTLPTEVRIAGCTATPCKLVRGTDADMQLDFIIGSSTDVVTLTPEVKATVLGLTVPYDLPAEKQIGCDWLIGNICPLSPTEDVTYNLLMPIDITYPKVKLTVQLALLDQNNQVLTCMRVDAEVVDP